MSEMETHRQEGDPLQVGKSEIVVPFIYQSRAIGFVRINHEGIFTSRDSFLFKWVEIKELALSTFMGVPLLRIVPWDLTEVAGRAKASVGPFYRFGINLTLMLFGHSKSLAPIGISQMALPISIDKLLTAIQEHFGAELHEYRITVRGWQKETMADR